MNKIEDIIKERIEHFKNKDYEKIYEIYSTSSEFYQFFPELDTYREHFFKLIDLFLPVSVEIYKVLYNNDKAEILYLEKIKNIEEDIIINYYVKSFFEKEDNKWKLIKEQREEAYIK